MNGIKLNGKGYDKKGNIGFEIKNGKGSIKEYNKYDELIFEGEYLNGKRNGKGKEYSYDGKLIFEGEYLNGEQWNGKGYDELDESEFKICDGNKEFII